MDRRYLRISLDTAQSGSIAKQRDATLAAVRGASVEYADESVSGSKVPFAERPAGARLLADLQRGDRVLVTKIDRAARNVVDLLRLVERIEAAGASIVFTEQHIDTAGPMGRLLLTLLGAIAEFEAELIAERRRESLAQFRREGRHAVGRAPYGLQSVPNPAGRGLVLRPHPERGPVVREAVSRIIAGEPQRVVAADIGLSTSGMAALVRNARIAGVVGYADDGSPRIDPAQALVTLAEWQALQDTLGAPVSRGVSGGIGPALSCSVCGERLYLQTSTRNPAYATYKCRGVAPVHRAGAGTAAVTASRADAYVSEQFLLRWGHLPVYEQRTVRQDADRIAAIASAQMALDAVRQAQDDAETDEQETALLERYLAAKRALRAAESLPDHAVVETVPTGQTFAEVWADADDTARSELLLQVGRWEVRPGRGLPIADKISVPDQQDYLAGQ